MGNINLFKFFRLDFCIRNLGLGVIAIFSLQFVPKIHSALLVLGQILLVQMHSFSMNNYFDFKIWKEDNYIGQLLISGFNRRVLIFLCLLPLFLLILTIPFSNIYLWILVVYVILFFLYQAPPWRLKNHYIPSILINSLCLGSTLYIYPYLFLAHRLDLTSTIFSIIFFFYLAFYEIVHQIAHMGKDNIYSLPEAVGVKNSMNIAIIFLIATIIGAIYALLLNPFKYFFFTGTVIFSSMRIFRLIETKPLPENFRNIRNRKDKFYSFQEGIYYLTFLTLNKLWK